MRAPRRAGSLVSMNVDRRTLPGGLAAAHRVLWAQAVLCAVAWLVPNAGVLVWLLAYGVPDDGTAPYLLIPVVFSLPFLVLAVPGLLIAARLPVRRRGVHTAAVLYEALWLALGAAAFAGGLRIPLGIPAPMLLVVASALAAAYVLTALLTPEARRHFRGDARG